MFDRSRIQIHNSVRFIIESPLVYRFRHVADNLLDVTLEENTAVNGSMGNRGINNRKSLCPLRAIKLQAIFFHRSYTHRTFPFALFASPHHHIRRLPHRLTLFSTSLPLVTTYLPTPVSSILPAPLRIRYISLCVCLRPSTYSFSFSFIFARVSPSPSRYSLLLLFSLPACDTFFPIPLQSPPRRGPSSHNAYPFSQFHLISFPPIDVQFSLNVIGFFFTALVPSLSEQPFLPSTVHSEVG